MLNKQTIMEAILNEKLILSVWHNILPKEIKKVKNNKTVVIRWNSLMEKSQDVYRILGKKSRENCRSAVVNRVVTDFIKIGGKNSSS